MGLQIVIYTCNLCLLDVQFERLIMSAEWTLTEEEKGKYIDKLTEELITLRAKAGIQQEEIARMIGVSRQTYGEIERKSKKMSWSTFLSLLFFFDQNKTTHQLLRQTEVFTDELVSLMNNGRVIDESEMDSVAGLPVKAILNSLDEQGLQSVRTVMMIEYARCKNISGDAVIKSFDGRRFGGELTKDDIQAASALKRIREKR